MRWLTLAFGLLVTGIVVSANLGIARPIFDLVNRVLGGDKICHFVLVGGLCFLVSTTLAGMRAKSSAGVISVVIIALLALATVEELSQLWLTRRTFALTDLACNYAGILVFGFLAIWWQSRKHRT